jgi:hypothetical protein
MTLKQIANERFKQARKDYGEDFNDFYTNKCISTWFKDHKDISKEIANKIIEGIEKEILEKEFLIGVEHIELQQIDGRKIVFVSIYPNQKREVLHDILFDVKTGKRYFDVDNEYLNGFIAIDKIKYLQEQIKELKRKVLFESDTVTLADCENILF